MSNEDNRPLTGSPGALIGKIRTLQSLSPESLGIRRLQKNLMSSSPTLDHLLAPSRKLIQDMMATPLKAAQAAVVGSTLLESQRLWQKMLAVSALSSSLGMTGLLKKMPRIELPGIGSAISKLAAIDWRALEARDEKALRFAAQHNWFIQPETPCDFAADIDACGGAIAGLNAIFTTITRELMPDIRARLVANFPHRAPLLDEIFGLHGERRYLASVPLALMCAEGIALDVCNASIFNTRKNRPEIAAWLDKQDLSNLAKIFLSSLSELHPMSKRRPGQLCRHEVLHGREVDYGTERHSLQAISLLGLIGWTFAADGLVTDSLSS